jgi:aspartate kinase
VGAALDAERVEIWTDVDGIRSTDPRLCRHTRHIESIGFQEAAELAQLGAKVLHPATLIPAMEKNIPVYVLNSRNSRHPGTCVYAEPQGAVGASLLSTGRYRGLAGLDQRLPAKLELGDIGAGYAGSGAATSSLAPGGQLPAARLRR